jgi:hypothetical protein
VDAVKRTWVFVGYVSIAYVSIKWRTVCSPGRSRIPAIHPRGFGDVSDASESEGDDASSHPVGEPVAASRVGIVGGGFGGLYSARELSGTPVQVTPIDKRNYHLFRPMLYQVATGLFSPDEIGAALRCILGNCRAKVGLECRQSDIDRRAVDEGHAGTDDGCSQNPNSRFGGTRNLTVARPDDGFVTRRFHELQGRKRSGMQENGKLQVAPLRPGNA